jgi:hypothetical protein
LAGGSIGKLAAQLLVCGLLPPLLLLMPLLLLQAVRLDLYVSALMSVCKWLSEVKYNLVRTLCPKLELENSPKSWACETSN